MWMVPYNPWAALWPKPATVDAIVGTVKFTVTFGMGLGLGYLLWGMV